MTSFPPGNQAAEDLALWELAMKDQRAAERQLEVARRRRGLHSVYPLHAKVMALRTRSDLLLARAVETMLAKSSDAE
jgi:hypothetical protein